MTFRAGHDPERFWCVARGDPDQVVPGLGAPDVRLAHPDRPALSFWWGDQRQRLCFAADGDRGALVAGEPDGLAGPDPAVALLRGYGRLGAAVSAGLGGCFSAVVADAPSGSLLAIRDPMGAMPLFYAVRGEGLAVSPSSELLAAAGADRPAPDRLALAEWILTTSTPIERTLYDGVARVPPGHVLLAVSGSARVSRYWNPSIARPGDRLGGEEALRRFDRGFDRAVERCARLAPCGVYLSGGLDSALAAAALAEHHARNGLPPPLAMTLRFTDPAEDEGPRAGRIAARLGLEHLVVPLEQALEGKGLFPAGIEASERAWYPTTSPWMAASAYLRREALRRGYRSALSGDLGNDLLESPWELAGDLLRRGEVVRLLGFLDAQRGYYGGRRRDWVASLVWGRGVKALARPLAHRALLATIPGRVAGERARRAGAALPAWSLPDPGLRAEVVARRAAVEPALSVADLHGYARRRLLESPFNTITLEGLFLASRRAGFADSSPYVDTELVSLVLALPPRTLQLGGHAKGLARESFGRRVDADLGRWLRPSTAEGTCSSAYAAEAGVVLARLDGLPRLAALGIVSLPEALAFVDPAARGPRSYYQRWHLLSTEAWLQARGL